MKYLKKRKGQDPNLDPFVRGTDPRIRILFQMSRIISVLGRFLKQAANIPNSDYRVELWIRIPTGGWIIYGFRKVKIAQAKSPKRYFMFLTGVLARKRPYIAFHDQKNLQHICNIILCCCQNMALYQDSAKNMDPH
jgi:hypothetical protein